MRKSVAGPPQGVGYSGVRRLKVLPASGRAAAERLLRRSIPESLATLQGFAIPESLVADRSGLVDTLSRLNVELTEREFVQRGENQYGPPVTTATPPCIEQGVPRRFQEVDAFQAIRVLDLDSQALIGSCEKCLHGFGLRLCEGLDHGDE